MKELSKAYEPKNYEDQIYKKWEESGLFNPDICVKKGVTSEKADYFSIVLPPPNVTGTLHMGHAAMLAIQDVMVRFHRMKGDKTLWIPGTDHAAIATQTKVEKLLVEKGIKDPKIDLGRKKFLEEIKKFAQESHDIIVNQARKMGASLDWSREAFTLDEQRNLAVRTVFKKMYDDGLIYRGFRIVNWCPHCHSTLADDEVEYKLSKTKLYWIKYGPFVLATTRPETKLGDTAVAVHPNDSRYKEMVGKKFMIPGVLGKFEIIVVADESVDMDFGSGAIKVTPFHSFADYEIAKRHGIAGKQIINEDGKMMKNCGKYAGMTTEEAREAVVKDMKKMDLIDRIDDGYENNLSVCYRCGSVIEPLPSRQWFISVSSKFKVKSSKIKGVKKGQSVTLKKLMQQAVKGGQIEIIPDRFNKTYFHWIDNLRDWCISRQIWYGHQIPVWYRKHGSQKQKAKSQKSGTDTTDMHVGVEPPKDIKNWEQDPDTLDTWFSSGLWTFSTLGYPNLKAKDLKNYHPTSVMETGYDILFFWVARMILMTAYVLGDIPFKTVYLHGLVRDENGKKMSKSLGNVIDPLDMIAKYGTDATRLSLLIGSTPGNDVKLSEEKIAGFRNFTNKLWNISRFMLLNIGDPKIDISAPKAKTLADEWILIGLDKIIKTTSENIEKLNFSMAGEQLRDFTWGNLADWYLEIAKVEGKKSEILNYILNTILKLWHPFMPFVTEAIWREVYGKDQILMVEQWPAFVIPSEARATPARLWREESLSKITNGQRSLTPTSVGVRDYKYGVKFNLIKNIITSIRSLRATYKIEPAKKIGAFINAGNKEKLLRDNEEVIKALARLEKLEFVESGAEVYLDLAGAVDAAKEKSRIEKEIQELKKYIVSLENKLANIEFVKHAPKEVVEKEKQKLNDAVEKLKKLEDGVF